MKKVVEEQSKLVNTLKDLIKCVRTVKKVFFLNNIGLYLVQENNVLNNLRSKKFQIKKYNTRTST